MPSRNNRRAHLRRLTRIAVFLALSLALYMVEAQLVPPLPVPGAKLGLANLVTLILVYTDGLSAALAVAFARVLLGSLFAGTFLGIAFWPTLAGAVAATFAMALLVRLTKQRLGPVGVSIAGALTHNLAQLAAIYPFFPGAGLGYYLPLLVLLAIPAGLLTGLIGGRILRALPGAPLRAKSGARLQPERSNPAARPGEPGCGR